MTGTRLQALRVERDLTQEALAGAAQVSVRTIFRAEHGEPIREQMQHRIARALEVACGSLFGPDRRALEVAA